MIRQPLNTFNVTIQVNFSLFSWGHCCERSNSNVGSNNSCTCALPDNVGCSLSAPSIEHLYGALINGPCNSFLLDDIVFKCFNTPLLQPDPGLSRYLWWPGIVMSCLNWQPKSLTIALWVKSGCSFSFLNISAFAWRHCSAVWTKLLGGFDLMQVCSSSDY